MSTVNLYDVLGLENTCTKSEIKDAYHKFVKTVHPDKGGDAELFELITHAYNILKDSDKRANYDEIYKLSLRTNSNFLNMRNSFNTHAKFVEDEQKKMAKEDLEAIKKTALENYKIDSRELDLKHNYNPDDNCTMTVDESNQRICDLEVTREQEEIESVNENIFDDISPGNFNGKFNAAFDDLKKRLSSVDEQKQITISMPSAWNILSGENLSGYSTLDNSNLYDDTSNLELNNIVYSSLNAVNTLENKLSKKDISKLPSAPYVRGHKFIDEDYVKDLETRLQERNAETEELKSASFSSYCTDDTMGGYGIFSQLGMESSKVDLLTGADNKKVRNSYQKLLEIRTENKLD
jgi:curved DNA-binding protein CbpA